MKEFIEKLIGRLEELIDKSFNESINGYPFSFARNSAYQEVMTIVNQLAEEHKDNVMIDGQYCWQTCGSTEHCKECNRLCNGSIDYYENYDVLAEEYNNDFCEWKKKNSNEYVCNAHAEIHDSRVLDWCVCPYCGKKIKVVE